VSAGLVGLQCLAIIGCGIGMALAIERRTNALSLGHWPAGLCEEP
jgi:hypothetical protein